MPRRPVRPTQGSATASLHTAGSIFSADCNRKRPPAPHAKLVPGRSISHAARAASTAPSSPMPPPSDGLDAEVQPDEGEHQGLEVLDQIVEHAEALGVLALLHVQEGPDLGGHERDVLLAQHDLQLLPPVPVGRGPVVVVLLGHLAVLDQPFQLVQHALGHPGFLADHDVVLVGRVVGVPEAAVAAELELEELVAELALVAH
eukprot:CAMPEP_0206007436 /NCGR_PEP_ID=MMETSP1464-20131121/5763_1 /ASSEMBLY_ACC=CAM_ASM_001124 /TAXON_ID=119497 /ORGANISM="Exanthemachrysis gayraliae, Strain RCC1523" /LENGTH=201 /DNA_ID=CAMNT_0053380931 /DNA_START=213 /DNA_END=815 /DNA_ORIENTATION=-